MGKSEHSVVSAGVTLQAYSWGDSKNTPLVLLHGYPDNHLVWQGVAEQLAEHYYVVSYDVRGAGASSKPKGRAHYKLSLLQADFQAVVAALLGGRAFHLAGHDWGSIQGWEFVTTSLVQHKILSYTTISGPCLDHAAHWFRARMSRQGLPALLKQTMSSWYIAMFQLPVLPEMVWRAGLGRFWPNFLQHVEGVQDVAVNPNQTSAGMLGVWLYRANMVPKLAMPEARYAQCPVQLIVPTKDRYVSTALFEDLAHWVPELYRRDIDACHWVTLAEPERVAAMLTEFMGAVDHGTAADVLQAHRWTKTTTTKVKEAVA